MKIIPKIAVLLIHLIVLYSFLSLPNKLDAEEYVQPKNMENIAKNMSSQSGFYVTCGEKSLVKLEEYAANLSLFSAGELLGTLFMDPLEPNRILVKWYTKGTNGELILDPMKSDETKHIEFNTQNCKSIKALLDVKFNLMKNTVFKTY